MLLMRFRLVPSDEPGPLAHEVGLRQINDVHKRGQLILHTCARRAAIPCLQERALNSDETFSHQTNNSRAWHLGTC